MKTQKLFNVGAFIAVLGIVVFLSACGGDNNDDPPEITREFTFVIGENTLTIKDMRTGKNDKSLEGLANKIKDNYALQAHEPDVSLFLARNPTLKLEENTDYKYAKAYSSSEVGLNLGYMTSQDANIPELVSYAAGLGNDLAQ